jgi:hypothetical protein
MDQSTHVALRKIPYNKGKLVGQKAPLKLKDIWAIQVQLQIGRRTRELALFNLAIDSKLRSPISQTSNRCSPLRHACRRLPPLAANQRGRGDTVNAPAIGQGSADDRFEVTALGLHRRARRYQCASKQTWIWGGRRRSMH